MLNKKNEEHSFSVEMTSERCVKRISFQEGDNVTALFEGFLGKLERVSMVEDLMLQIEGADGVLRVDIGRQELEACLRINEASAGESERR